MSKRGKKILKWFLWSMAGLLTLVMVAVLTLPLWIGSVVTGVANKVVPEVTKTGFHLGEFGLNPYTGSVHVGDMQLQNPSRFFAGSEEKAPSEGILGAVTDTLGKAVDAATDFICSSSTNAVALTAVDVKLSTTSLLTDTIHIEEIVVKDLYVYGDLTFSNIREIVANAAGDAEKEEKKDEPKSEEAEGSGKKVIIDRVLLTGTKIKWGHLTIPLWDIEVKDIGKEEAVTEESAFDSIVDGICEAADSAKAGVGTALKAAINGGKAVGDAVASGAEAVTETVGKATDAVTGALNSLNPFSK